MDIRKILSILLFISVLCTATIIEVTVADKIRYVVDYTEVSEIPYWTVTANVENTGSVTCPVKMKLETRAGKFWSEEIILKPGEINLFKIPYVTNETEEGKVVLYFCDEVKEVGVWNITPSNLNEGNISAYAKVYKNYVILKAENATFIPLGPKNLVMPITHVEGVKKVEFHYPDNLSKPIKFLVFNSTHYTFIESETGFDWDNIKPISKIMLYILLGLIIGRVLNGL